MTDDPTLVSVTTDLYADVCSFLTYKEYHLTLFQTCRYNHTRSFDPLVYCWKQIKVLYNGKYGGFGLTTDAMAILRSVSEQRSSRFNQQFIRKIEEWGLEKASDRYAKLTVDVFDYPAWIPEDIIFSCIEISEYDGFETVILHKEKVILKTIHKGLCENMDQIRRVVQRWYIVNDWDFDNYLMHD